MKIIRNSLIPIGKGFGAINLFGVLFAKRDMHISPEVINHEKIHSAQMRELLYIPFYILYLLEWLVRLISHKGGIYDSYYAVSFEQEAYRHGDDLNYLKHRQRFAQWKEINPPASSQ